MSSFGGGASSRSASSEGRALPRDGVKGGSTFCGAAGLEAPGPSGVGLDIGGGTLETAAGIGGRAGTVNEPAHRGHFICCPAYCSGTCSIFWQFGQRRFMRADPVLGRETTGLLQ